MEHVGYLFDVAGWFGFLLPASGDGIDDFPNLAWVSGILLALTCEVLIPTTSIHVRCLSSTLPILLVPAKSDDTFSSSCPTDKCRGLTKAQVLQISLPLVQAGHVCPTQS